MKHLPPWRQVWNNASNNDQGMDKVSQVIDAQGYRANVGIILSNQAGQLLWARRYGEQGWQFPQGGIRIEESPEEALYRELREEIGLTAEDVQIMGCTRHWLRYQLPPHLIRHGSKPLCIGQKQLWYLLRLLCDEDQVCLDLTDKPEFDQWRWIDYWQPVTEVISFKRKVYRTALEELAPLLLPEGGKGDVSHRRQRQG